MGMFLFVCTVVGACFVMSFLLRALGKAICWTVGAVAVVAYALVIGSFALVGLAVLALAAWPVLWLFAAAA